MWQKYGHQWQGPVGLISIMNTRTQRMTMRMTSQPGMVQVCSKCKTWHRRLCVYVNEFAQKTTRSSPKNGQRTCTVFRDTFLFGCSAHEDIALTALGGVHRAGSARGDRGLRVGIVVGKELRCTRAMGPEIAAIDWAAHDDQWRMAGTGVGQ